MLPPGIPCQSLYGLMGPYQGVGPNVRKSWLRKAANKKNLNVFMCQYKKVVTDMSANPTKTIPELAVFFNVPQATAAAVFDSLWQPNGVNDGFCFSKAQLNGTESIFTRDDGVKVPRARWWLKDLACPKRACRRNG